MYKRSRPWLVRGLVPSEVQHPGLRRKERGLIALLFLQPCTHKCKLRQFLYHLILILFVCFDLNIVLYEKAKSSTQKSRAADRVVLPFSERQYHS